jgi:hypothetical protein
VSVILPVTIAWIPLWFVLEMNRPELVRRTLKMMRMNDPVFVAVLQVHFAICPVRNAFVSFLVVEIVLVMSLADFV